MSKSNSNSGSWGTIRSRVEQYIERIEQHDATLNAVWTPTFDSARQQADAADAIDAQGSRRGRLHGVVVGLKDNIETDGVKTTTGSKLFENYVPDADATVWQRMRDEGAIMIGKVGLHECVFGASSQNEWFGRIRNPWSTDHIPGGSSGGSGAAVAAEFCDVALGTDTGGSVRIPAAICGLAGLRPTMGAVSNHRVRPISPHLDTVGPMAYRVEDVARSFAAMQGYDEDDDTSANAPADAGVERIDALLNDRPSLAGIWIGVPTGFFQSELHPSVKDAFTRSQEVFKDLGAVLVDIDVNDAARASTVCASIIVADAADYYKDDIKNRSDLISHQTMRRLSLGFDVSGIDYAGHMRFMFQWQRRIDRLFSSVDVILTPTVRAPAVPISRADDLIEITNTITPFTMAWALSAVPTLALPIGFCDEALPVSCQLAARRWAEPTLFRAGLAFQQATDFHEKRPSL